MRIGMQTWGSEGDVRPFLALAGGLADAGHDVTLVITEVDDRDYRHYASRLGVDIRMVASPVLKSVAEMQAIGEKLLALGDPFRQGRYIGCDLFEREVPAMLDAARKLAADSDVMIRHFFHHPASVAAELAGIPDVSVSFSPDAIPSREYPPAALPDLGRIANRCIWAIASRLLDRTFLPPVNALRTEHGLLPFDAITEAWYSRTRHLLAMSPAIRPPASDWDRRYRVPGYLSLRGAGGFDPIGGDVEGFLDDGYPPVFVTFGSLTPGEDPHRREIVELLLAAVRKAGCRAMIQGIIEPGRVDTDVLSVGRLPHAAVFPRCAAVVHHAGAGTTQTVVAAGVPSVPVPHLADQFFWAAQLHRLGVATRPVRRTRLGPWVLARRIEAALASRAMTDRAASTGAAMRAESGVETAVSIVERLMENIKNIKKQ